MAAEDDDLGNLWFRLGVEPDDESARRAFAEMGRQINDYFKRIQDQFDATAKEQAKSQRAASSATAKEQKKGFDAQEALLRAFIAQFQRLQKAHVDKMLADNAASNARRLEGQQSLNKALLQEQKQRDREALQEQEHVNKEIRNQSRLAHEQILDDYKQLNREIIQDQILANRKILESDAQANRHRMENHKQRNRESLQQQKAGDALYLEEQKKANRESLQNQRIAASQSLAEQRREHDKRLEEIRQANRKELEDHRQANRETLATLNEGIKSRLMAQRSGEKIAEQAAAAAEKRKTLEMEYAEKRRLSVQDAAQQKSINAHKSMWAIIRTITETGGRFLSSITQSALKSMGNAVGYGMRGVLSRFRRSTDQQEDVLRASYKQQEAITRGGLAQQQGAIASFQARANRGLIGTLFNLRNVLAGAGVYLSARAIFGPVMDFQKYQVSFEALLGSAERATNFLDRIRQFSAETPFDLGAITSASQKLLAFGFAARDVIPMMTTIGDATSVLGQGEESVAGVIRALGQMRGRGKAAAEEMNQISDALPGFSAIEAVADKMGITVAEAFDQMRAGAIPADLAISAILEGMADMPGAAGAMDRASKTLEGRLQNLGETLRILVVDAISPFTDNMADAIGVLTDFIHSLFRGEGVWAVARSTLMGIGIALGLIVAQEAAATVLDAVGQTLKLIAANPLTAFVAAAVVLGTVLYRHNQDFRDFVDGFLGGIGDFVRQWSGPAVATLSAIGESLGKIGSAIAAGDWGGVREMASSAMGALTDMASNVAEFARPFAEVLVAAVQYAFWSLQAWMDSGGMGRLRDMVADVWDRAWATIADLDLSRFVQPALIGLGAAIAYAIGGIPLLLVTALVAASPRIRDGLGQVLGTIGTYITDELPGVLLRAVEAAGRFLGGPFLATVLSKPVQTALFALVGVAVVAAGRFALGFIDGLRDSLPKIINATQELVESMLLAIRDALGDLPGVFDIALAPLGTLLLGIMPTIELFVNLIAHIPTPVIAAIAAFALMRRALMALQGSWAAQKLVGLIEWVQALPALFARAGAAVTAWGSNLAATQAQMLTATGGLSPVRTGLAGIGMAATGAGGAITAMGAALPAIGIAAAVGLPLVLGMWQQSQAAARAHREEIQRNASAMLDLQTTARDLFVEMIRESNGAAVAMNEAGVTVDELYQSLDSAAEVGTTFAALMGQTQAFADAGVDMTAFGEAVLKGNDAVSNYFDTLKNGVDRSDVDWQQHVRDITDLQESYRGLDDALGDAVVEMADNAEAMLNQAAATGQLTDAQLAQLAAIQDSENPEAAYLALAEEVTSQQQRRADATSEAEQAQQRYNDRVREAIGSLSMFRDEVDRLNGGSIDLTRSALQLQEAYQSALAQATEGGMSYNEIQLQFLDLVDQSIQRVDDLNNAGQSDEAQASYAALRQQLLDMIPAFDLTTEQAEALRALVSESFPDVDFSIQVEDREALDKVEGLRRKADRMRALAEEDIRFSAIADDFDAEADAIEARLQGFTGHTWDVYLQFHAELDGQFQTFLASAAGSGITPEDLAQLANHAKGGLVTRPEVALIGEAGPELILPLSDPKRMAELLAQNASALASAMPAVTASAPPTTVASSVMTAAPTVNAEGIAAWIAATAAALAPLGETIALATAPGFETWYASIDSVLTRIDARFKAWGGALTVAASGIGAGVVSALTVALQSGSGEVTSIVRGFGRSLVGALNPLLTGIGEPAVTLAYAKGGIAEAHAGPQVHVFNEGKRGRGSSHGEAYIPFDPSNRSRSRNLATETVRRLGGDVQWFANGGLTADAIRRGQSFARAQDGKPYSWGAVGPSAYDCSGLASAIINAVRGQDPYHRLFTSGSLVAGVSAGLIPGLGQVSVGARPGSPGHVSTTIAGLNAEATGDHVRIGAAAASAADFPSKWHLGSGVFIGPDGTTYPLPVVPAITGHGELGRTGSGWMRYVRARSQSFVDANTYTGMAFTGNEFGVPAGMQGGGGGSPEVMAAIRRAMSIVGVPASWLGPLLTLISRESGFNPRAYNGVLGASGLMQTIPGTFANHALPGYGGIFDPLANVIAGLRYILSRYGSIFNVGQAVSASPTHGYSYGGVVERDGMYRLAEGNRREVVLPLENRGRLLELLRRTGLDKTIAMASGVHPDNGLLPVGSATSRTSPSLGPVVGEMNVYSNATDPEAVGTIAANKVDRQVRSVLTGVGSL